MPARRVASENETLSGNAVSRTFAFEPRHCFARFLGDPRNGDVRTEIVVDHGDANAMLDKRRRHERMLALVEGAPVTAVNEEQGSSRIRRGKEIHRLLRAAAVANVEMPIEAFARHCALLGPA